MAMIKGPTIDKETKEAAKALFLAGVPPAEVGSRLAVAPATVLTWAKRGNWRKLRVRFGLGKESIANTGENGGSERVRGLLGMVVERQAKVLANQQPTLSSLRNTATGEGFASVAKKVADTASVVFDWSSARNSGVIVIGEIERLQDVPQAIDVQSEIQADTTSGSGSGPGV